MAKGSRSDISESYSGKNATFIKQGQETGRSYGSDSNPKGMKSEAATKATGKSQ